MQNIWFDLWLLLYISYFNSQTKNNTYSSVPNNRSAHLFFQKKFPTTSPPPLLLGHLPPPSRTSILIFHFIYQKSEKESRGYVRKVLTVYGKLLHQKIRQNLCILCSDRLRREIPSNRVV